LNQAAKTMAVDPNCAHHDLIGAIWNFQKELWISLKFEHVKGHQDKDQPMAHTWLASMNIEMDEEAKLAIQTGYQGPIQYRLLGEGWCCYINKERIMKHLATKYGITLTVSSFKGIGSRENSMEEGTQTWLNGT